ncbi:reductive dehalogenase [Desulfuribacillus alkaliarsenatis]|uniref:Reductive dehalogenase n=1 Tax=Desulfuribacillus alkaliarsenatis TaxID=766136 RepID=A0A1E5G4I6_9FIRM|nr:reductive dehalogenase [Desulfuribacillus alkaliarsenatis]OEF98003.1 reductive dehalogenase [Desulfuribacillus alkaliarsenatis]
MNNNQNTAAKIHEVGEEYQRFNQKNHVIMQTLWNEELKDIDAERNKILKEHVQSGKQGYNRFDYAFHHGAMNFIDKIGFGINVPDQSANSWDNFVCSIPYEGAFEDPVETTKVVKKAAMMYGADAVGITKLDRRWVYSEWYDPEKKESFPIRFSDENSAYHQITKPVLMADGTRVLPKAMDTVIVLMFEMNYDRLRYAPTLLAYGETSKVYTDMCKVSMNVAGFINALGFNALPSINCTALNVPLAIDAGLGQIGRHGKVISPTLGSRTRVAKIITDMPLLPDEPIDFGVTEFCDTCKKCARECPSNAISNGKRAKEAVDETGNSHYLRWIIDHKRCYKYWAECGTNCNICLYVCPYNRGYRWTRNVLDLTDDRNTNSNNMIDSLEDIYSLDGLSARSHKYWKKE